MKKLNMELKKLQGFQQQSELEVRVWGGGGTRAPFLLEVHKVTFCRQNYLALSHTLWLLGSLHLLLFWTDRQAGRSEQGRPLLVTGNKRHTLRHSPKPIFQGREGILLLAWSCPCPCPCPLPSLCTPEQVHNFDKKLEEMSNQVLQWQRQHQSDLKMLAAKEAQLREFQEEMAALRENLLADEKEVGTV